jgi:prepilin signal peptidase PulO-like enzyme (type II secretory pathway)
VNFVLFLLLGVVLLAITIIDSREHRIPDVLSLPLIPIGLLFAQGSLPASLAEAYVISPDRLVSVFIIGAALVAVAKAYQMFRNIAGLGLGDVKLAMAAAAWISPSLVPLWLFLSAVSALAFALFWRMGAQTRIAFGSFMAPWFFIIYVSDVIWR